MWNVSAPGDQWHDDAGRAAKQLQDGLKKWYAPQQK